jgi:hypothetical protein
MSGLAGPSARFVVLAGATAAAISGARAATLTAPASVAAPDTDLRRWYEFNWTPPQQRDVDWRRRHSLPAARAADRSLGFRASDWQCDGA